MKRLLLAPLLITLTSCYYPKFNDSDFTYRWVDSITIPEGSSQTYLPKQKDLLLTVVYETWSPLNSLKDLKIGDVIIGTDGKDKLRKFTVGAIKCELMEMDWVENGIQYMWKDRWFCIAGRNKEQVIRFYEKERLDDYFTTSPIDIE